MITPLNHPVLVKDIPFGFLCIGELGRHFFVNVSQNRKVKLCNELGKDGFLIRPRRSPHTFCKGKCTVNFYQLERAMLYANRQCLRIAIYGIKIPVCDIISPPKHLRCKKRRVQETKSICNPIIYESNWQLKELISGAAKSQILSKVTKNATRAP